MSGQLIINPLLTGLNGIFHLLSSQWGKKKTHTHTHTLLQEKQNRIKFLIIRLHCTWCSSSILFACSAFQTYNFSSSRLLQVIYKMKNFYLSLTVSANMRPAKILHSSWNLYQLDIKVQCGGGKSHLFSHIDSKPFVIITLWDFVGLGGFFFFFCIPAVMRGDSWSNARPPGPLWGIKMGSGAVHEGVIGSPPHSMASEWWGTTDASCDPGWNV